MKRLSVFFVLVLTLLSIAALTSCGCEASNQTDQNSQTGTPNENTGSGSASNGSANNGTGSGSANNGSAGSGSGSANNGSGSTMPDDTVPGDDSLMDDIIDGGEDIMDGVDDAIDDITGSGSAGSSTTGNDHLPTYEDMLRNGRVRDQDGFLNNNR